MDSALAGLQLPQLIGRRERNTVEIIPTVIVGDADHESKVAGPGGFMEYVLGATESSAVAFPWRKDEPKRATEEEREAERRRRRRQEAAANASSGSRRAMTRSDTFKQLESALEETMVRTNNGADAAQVGISKGHLNKLKRTIGVIMWLKSRVGSKKGQMGDDEKGIGDGDDSGDEEDASGSGSEGEAVEEQFTRPPEMFPRATTGSAAEVPKLKLGGLARSQSKNPRGALKFSDAVAYESEPMDQTTNWDENKETMRGPDSLERTGGNLLPGLEAASFHPLHPASGDDGAVHGGSGDLDGGGAVGSAFLNQFFSPPPPDTLPYVPDHREVQGFATQRERRRPAAQPPATTPLIMPAPTMATEPQPSQHRQQWYGIAYAPGVRPWTPRGGASPHSSLGFHGGPLRRERPVIAPPGSGGVFPQRGMSPNRGWHTDRGAGGCRPPASGWALEMPGATIDLLAGRHPPQQLPRLLPSDRVTQVKHAKLCVSRGSDGSADSSRMVLKPSCFNARIRTPR